VNGGNAARSKICRITQQPRQVGRRGALPGKLPAVTLDRLAPHQGRNGRADYLCRE
jgi:hypothetical protein